MRSRFFTPTYKAIKISPYFVFKVMCGASLLYDAATDSNENNNELFGLRTMIGLQFMFWGLRTIKLNYGEYQHILGLFEKTKNRYRRYVAKPFLHTHCNRMQLKEACKDKGMLAEYKAHLKHEKIKWYMFEENSSQRINFMVSTAAMVGVTLYSHQKKM